MNISLVNKTVDKTISNLEKYSLNRSKHQKDIKKSLDLLKKTETLIKNTIHEKLNSQIPIENTEERNNLESRLVFLKQYKHINDSHNNPLEHFGFNFILYNLYHPYNLNEYIKNLKSLIFKLKKMNIHLTEEDFNYTYFVKKVMTKFINNIDNIYLEDIIKEEIDTIYWKNYHILTDILINVIIIIKNNKKNILKYSENLRTKFVMANKINEDTIMDEYYETYIDLINFNNKSPLTIVEKFKSKELSINQFIESSPVIVRNRNKFIKETAFNILTEKGLAEFYNNIEQLSLSIYEYENYSKYSYILDSVATIEKNKVAIQKEFADKEKRLVDLYRSNDVNAYKISMLYKYISKINSNNIKKISKIKNIIADLTVNSDRILSEIRTIYDNYDELAFNNNLLNKITLKMTIFDIYKFYYENYKALRKIITKNNQTLEEEEIIKMIDEFKEFMNDPRIKILNSVNYLNIADLTGSISSIYKLLGLNIDINNISSSSFDDLKKSCDFLTNYNHLIKSGWNPDVLKAYLEII